MDKLCMVFSHAFDIIENEQLGASENHSLRVAVLCIAMGKRLGYDDDAISAIATCGMFHDSALTEYRLSQTAGPLRARNMILHCEKGQENVSWLPFKTNIDKFVLYHHERGDGEGPFQKKEREIPLETALIAAADAVDATHHLQRVRADELPALRGKIASRANAYATKAAIDALLDVFDEDLLEKLRDENIMHAVKRELPPWEVELLDPRVLCIGEFIARVIDYKSVFTHLHTSQAANRVWIMSGHYGCAIEERHALFLAASLHDIGKIAIPTEILEKPGKLDDAEFNIIKRHVANTLDWLGAMPDFELIRNWASDHHEKLNGLGYSRGKDGSALDFNSRLLACIDIYQAVCESRPYHTARSHEETMRVLYDMSSQGLVDAQIVKDLDDVMAEYSMRSVPSPLGGEECKSGKMRRNGERAGAGPGIRHGRVRFAS
ncbi:MAG: HD domain-containing protein [Deltaproteobacteria bacterium]|nr:HD domain-containing protein [Deltaproteobacteria bacterium]